MQQFYEAFIDYYDAMMVLAESLLLCLVVFIY